MKIVSIDPINPAEEAIEQAAKVLRHGGTLLYPTDTCYGLGTDARSEQGRRKIQKLKGRDEAKRFSVIVQDFKQLEKIAAITDRQWPILEHYLPGPFTFVVLNADFQISNSNTIGIRIPKFAVTQDLAAVFGEPFITTSANVTGTGALYSLEDIREKLLEQVDAELWPDLILDAGLLTRNQPSTVVDLTRDPPHIIRQGEGIFYQ